MKIKRFTGILLTATFILLIPLVAMLFTQEAGWDLRDFIIMGVLLYGTGICIELIMRKVKDNNKRVFYAVVILGALFLVWAELAVGIFGSPFAGS